VLAPDMGVQYAHSFDLPADMPPNALVSINLEYAADNLVREVSFGDTNNPVPLIALPQGNFQTPTIHSTTGAASGFGLIPGLNNMFFRVCDTDERASGLIYSVTLTVDYCKLEFDLCSGVGSIPDNAEVDVVFLIDTTGSMAPVINQIQIDLPQILTYYASYSQDFRIGIASYKDFNTSGSSSSSISDYVYSLDAPLLPLTPFGTPIIISAVQGLGADGGGGDGPEAQFYALHRLADNFDGAVGWRANSIRIIVLIGDCPAHDPICPSMHDGTMQFALDSTVGFACDNLNCSSAGAIPITEASVISELQANGIWGGTKVIAVDTPTNTTFCPDGLDTPPFAGFYDDAGTSCGASYVSATIGNQATRLASSTGGTFLPSLSATGVTTAIYDAIDTVFLNGTPYPCGSTEPNNVVHSPFWNTNAYNDISNGLGVSSLVVCPNSNWIPMVPGGSAWIHSSHDSSASDGTGRPPESVLHAHPFQLGSFPTSTATVFLDLAWAASDSLYGVSINADVLSPGGNVSIGGVPGWDTSNEYAFASNGTFSGPASSFNWTVGLNRLFLSQYERAPGSIPDNDDCSGITYCAKMSISFPCELPIAYEIFCECVGDWAVCMNPGGPGEGCENSTGAGGALTASGTYTNTTLNADNLPLPGTIGLFFVGNTPIGPFHLGDGLRCVGGDPVRIGIVSTNTGHAHLPIGPSQPGEFYQFWYRDNWGPCNTGFNLTNAIEIQ